MEYWPAFEGSPEGAESVGAETEYIDLYDLSFTGCGTCADACPGGCISTDDIPCVIDQAQCLCCGSCAEACPVGAIEKR